MSPPNLDKAHKMRNKAKSAADALEHIRAAKLYLKAVNLYKKAGSPYWQNISESWMWSEKAMVDADSAEEDFEQAEYFDRAIQASNSALQYPEADQVVLEGNMRQDEGNKYYCLSNAEVRHAKETSGEQKVIHLRQAAEYCLSGAIAKKQAAETDIQDGDEIFYLHRMGQHHSDRSRSHYYRAWAAEVLGEWQEALTEYELAKAEREKGIDFIRKSLNLEYTETKKQSLESAEEWVISINDEIEQARSKAEWIMRERANLPEAAATAPPKLDVIVEATEGMVENLVSTLSVALDNSGEGEAHNINVELASQFLSGDTTASLTRLEAYAKNRVGLSVLPTHAGTPTATLIISYENAKGELFSRRTDTTLKVARRGENRPKGGATIINVQGDYATGAMLKDSVVSKSNLDEGGGGRLDSLRELIQWRQDGLISDDEFKAAKSKLLG